MDYSDAQLIQEIQNGSKTAFDLLMQRYQEHVYMVSYSFTKERESAMDVSQNIFIKVYQNISRFRGDSQFKTWLMRIAYNENQNWVTANRRFQDFDDLEENTMPATDSISQEDEILARENRAVLLRCLFRLNNRYRVAVVLRYFRDYSIRDIAQTLDCSEGVVKNMLFRSLQKMKSNLNTTLKGDWQ